MLSPCSWSAILCNQSKNPDDILQIFGPVRHGSFDHSLWSWTLHGSSPQIGYIFAHIWSLWASNGNLEFPHPMSRGGNVDHIDLDYALRHTSTLHQRLGPQNRVPSQG